MSDGFGPGAGADGMVRRWVEACTVWCEMDGAAVVIGLGAGGPAGTRGRQVVFASDGIAAAMADVQFVLGCGPHHTAVTTCSVSSTAHGAELDRWPVLTTELTTVGVRSVYAAPMVGDAARQRCALGSVQLYSSRAVTLAPRARALLSLTAHTVFNHLIDRAAVPSGLVRDSGTDADVVNRAIGVLAVRRGVSTADAEALLRADAYARGSNSANAARRVLGIDAGSS